MKKNTGVIVILVLAVGVLGFFGGMKFSEFQRIQKRSGGNGQFQMGPNGQSMGQTNGKSQTQTGSVGRPITGEIIQIDETSVTVKTQDGGSKIIILSGSTTYSKTTEGSKSDLSVGTTIGVFGTENTDKSVTAQTIQLNPQFGKTNASPSAK